MQTTEHTENTGKKMKTKNLKIKSNMTFNFELLTFNLIAVSQYPQCSLVVYFLSKKREKING